MQKTRRELEMSLLERTGNRRKTVKLLHPVFDFIFSSHVREGLKETVKNLLEKTMRSF